MLRQQPDIFRLMLLSAAFCVLSFTQAMAQFGDAIKFPNIPGVLKPAPQDPSQAFSLPEPLAEELDKQIFGELPVVLDADDANPTIAVANLPVGRFTRKRLH